MFGPWLQFADPALTNKNEAPAHVTGTAFLASKHSSKIMDLGTVVYLATKTKTGGS